ncbi:MAG TPA: hypothetical protein VF294_16560 [Polyangiaceae bacterium]
MSLTARSALLLLALGTLQTSVARAEESTRPPPPAKPAGSDCARAYEQAQEQRHSGKLLESRLQLEQCAKDECPEFIRADCSAWYNELQAELPSVVLAARSAGQDLPAVRVSAAQRLLAASMDGQAVELDPGEYDFEFTAAGMQPHTEHVLISRGEHNRLLRVELVPIAEDQGAKGAPASSPPRSWLVPGVLGGVAVVGLASFGAFGVWGHSGETQLQSTCSPGCSKAQISSVKTRYTVADVSLAVGVASLGLAAYFALSPRPEQRAAQASHFDVRASAAGLSATYAGAF